MPEKSNRIIVRYANNEVRIRNVQSTVYPSKHQKGYITNINMWYLHIRMVTDAMYNAHHAIDTVVATDMLLADAQEILNIPPDTCSYEAD